MLTLIDVNFPSSIDLIHDTCYLCTRKDFDFSNGVWLNSEKKNILQIDFEVKKNLARKYPTFNGSVCQGKENSVTRGLRGKKTQTKSRIPPIKVKWSAPYACKSLPSLYKR